MIDYYEYSFHLYDDASLDHRNGKSYHLLDLQKWSPDEKSYEQNFLYVECDSVAKTTEALKDREILGSLMSKPKNSKVRIDVRGNVRSAIKAAAFYE